MLYLQRLHVEGINVLQGGSDKSDYCGGVSKSRGENKERTPIQRFLENQRVALKSSTSKCRCVSEADSQELKRMRKCSDIVLVTL